MHAHVCGVLVCVCVSVCVSVCVFLCWQHKVPPLVCVTDLQGSATRSKYMPQPQLDYLTKFSLQQPQLIFLLTRWKLPVQVLNSEADVKWFSSLSGRWNLCLISARLEVEAWKVIPEATRCHAGESAVDGLHLFCCLLVVSSLTGPKSLCVLMGDTVQLRFGLVRSCQVWSG